MRTSGYNFLNNPAVSVVLKHLQPTVRLFFLINRLAIRIAQEIFGHADVSTTMIYTHVLQAGAGGKKPGGFIRRTGKSNRNGM